MIKVYLDGQGEVHIYPYAVQHDEDYTPAATLERAQKLAERLNGEVIALDQPTPEHMEIIAAQSGFTQTDDAHIFVASVMNGWNGLTVEQQLMLTQLKQQQTIDALIMAQLGGTENV